MVAGEDKGLKTTKKQNTLTSLGQINCLGLEMETERKRSHNLLSHHIQKVAISPVGDCAE
jgi:hypothetical protein